MADVLERLRRAAAMAKKPEDRAWAASRYKELSGGEAADSAPDAVSGDASAAPDVPSRAALNPLDATMMKRETPPTPAGDGGIMDRLRHVGRIVPEPVEAFMNKANDTFTHGAWPRISDAIGITNADDRNKLAAANPTASDLGSGTGAGLSAVVGPAAMASRGVAAGVEALAPDLMGSMQARYGAPALAGAALGYAQGGNVEDAVAGAVAGLAGQAAGDVASAGAGLARKGVQALSPWVRKAAEADTSGAMEGAKALPRGREGVVRATEGARDQVMARDSELMSRAGDEYQSAVGQKENLPANVQAIHDAIDEMRAQNRMPSSGQPIDENLEASLMSLKNKVSPPGEHGPATSSNADMLRMRRSLKQASGFGNASPTDAQVASRGKYDAINQGIHSASPDIAAADDAYSQAAANSEDVHQILGQASGGPIVGREPMRRAAAQLEYMGDESMPALQREPDLRALAAKDPEYAKALKQLEAKKALEATRLLTTEPGVRSSISPALGQLPIIGGTAKLAQQYGRGALRLTDRALGATQGAAQMSPRAAMSLLDLILQQREQEQNK